MDRLDELDRRLVNALENVLEIRDPELAERLAAWIDEVRARYGPAPVPEIGAS